MENNKQGAFAYAAENGYQKGLTKREYFAGLAMQGILANNELRHELLADREHDETTGDNCVAVYAVKQADELFKQLEK